MKNIEVKILNPQEIKNAEKMLVCTARLTQRGERIHSLDDFMELYEKPYTEDTIQNLVSLPHPTIQKFGCINVVVVGASRRFLSQITRHQNEVKFMSASLQYSDYSSEADFVIPYELLETPIEKVYKDMCGENLENYEDFINGGWNNDIAGYIMPQSLRNTLIISATPFQWKYMIHLRTCRRNTDETRYVMLKIWETLYNESPALFSECGPFCTNGYCREGKMSCGTGYYKRIKPAEILKSEFPKLYEK